MRNFKNYIANNNWWLFFLITYLISWPIWLAGYYLLPSDLQVLTQVIGAFGPFLAALFIISYSKGKSDLKEWLRTIFNFRINIWWIVAGAIFLPFGLALIHHMIYLLLGGQSGADPGIVWLGYFAYLIPTALLSGGNEEPGWRGYITPVLLRKFHPVITCIIIGVFWALWHLPIYLDEGWGGSSQPIVWLIAYCIPLSMIMTWLFYRSRKSVIPVMLFHAGSNVVFQYFPMQTNVFNSVEDEFTVIKTIVYVFFAIILLIMC